MVYETRMFERERTVAEAAAREAGAIVKRYYEKPIEQVAKTDRHRQIRRTIARIEMVLGERARAAVDGGQAAGGQS